jgi:hypothetical protein
VPEQDPVFRFLGALRIGVPMAFALTGLCLVLAVAIFLPDHWNLGALALALSWLVWLAAAGIYMKESVAPFPPVPSSPPPKPSICTELYAKARPFAGPVMAAGAPSLFVLSALVLLGYPAGWLWAGGLAIFMAAQYFSKWDAGDKNGDVYSVQHAPTGATKRRLTYLFVGLAGSYALWFICAIYITLVEYAHFGGCEIYAMAPLVVTLLFVGCAGLLFGLLLYHGQFPNNPLEENFPKRFMWAFAGLGAVWLVLTGLIYCLNAATCPIQFMTIRSGLAVGTLFLLAWLIRFVLLRL